MDNALPSYLSGFVQSFCHCGNEKKYSWELKSSKLGRKWTQFFSMFNVEKCVSSGRKNSDNHLYPHSQLSIQKKVR